MVSRSLNVGSGNHPAPGWVNVDIAAHPGVDVQASVYDLPFAAGTFDRVYLGHVLEHLMWEDIPAALAEIARVAPGADLMLVGPCLTKAIETDQPTWLLRQILTGTDMLDPSADAHRWSPTTDHTARALAGGGCVDVVEVHVATTVGNGWPNTVPDPWQCAFTARLPIPTD